MSKKIMVQGTMSNAGKSLITAGLLRVFAKDGHKAAPFKSQNMALNSFVTKEGLEIGRAQAMQAEAAMTEVIAAMNPILLKPNSDTGSQVIVNGEVLSDMPAKEYFRYKKKLVPDILKAFHSLEEQYDTIVIEGAGSPAEINLKQEDIVNMGMAEMVDAPVLLAADIDRGGVFAQIYGTVMLLEPHERERIKGIIINKFRGDVALLQPGIEQIEALCGIPVVGVLPFLKVDIDEEDSLSERIGMRHGEGALKIAVVRLPHISNYTDFAPLEEESTVSLCYTVKKEELQKANVIILPGSKNTLGDLQWLKETGLDTVIRRCAKEGAVVIGVCGGYQMLGETITEEQTMVRGLSLLPADTVFAEQKVRTRVQGRVTALNGDHTSLSGLELEGYEIHMGVSRLHPEAQPFCNLTDQNGGSKEDGCVNGQIFGTYLHGLFDADAFRTVFLQFACKHAGIPWRAEARADRNAYRQQQYDILEQAIRENLDMEAIYKMLR